VEIHQLQVRYDALADRLLVVVRTRQGELIPAWLTRRMSARLRTPLRDAVTRLGLPRTAPDAIAVPEAKAMLEQAARDRPLPTAEFGKPFETQGASYPLGPEPLLPAQADIRLGERGGLLLALREERGRRLELQLSDDLATALLRLIDQALAVADWDLPAEATATPSGEAPPLSQPLS
jgi:hypothetical protein